MKMERKLQKPHLTDYSLLMDLCQAHCQILLKEFVKLNANMGMMIKNVKRGIKYRG